MASQDERVASCECGRVRLRVSGAPIITAVCYCDDCQAGARKLEEAGAHTGFRDPWGGTPYATYRDDRLALVEGAALLSGVKLGEGAPTTRFVATCCGTAIYLKHAPGWWTSVYRARFGDDAPPIELRNQVRFLPDRSVLPKDLPVWRSFAPVLIARLLRARLAMWLRR